jgi:hypothetical protein
MVEFLDRGSGVGLIILQGMQDPERREHRKLGGLTAQHATSLTGRHGCLVAFCESQAASSTSHPPKAAPGKAPKRIESSELTLGVP